MGAKVQFDNYYSMRDLNCNSSGTSWPLHHAETNLPTGQYHYNTLPRTTPNTFPGVDKELLKQKMLEHEAEFRSQVFELHRLYSVQKDLMGKVQKIEQFKHRTAFETSSSSSPLPAQLTPDDAHRQNSSSFLFTNGVCGGPPLSDPEYIRPSVDGSTKGKSAQCGPVLSQNCVSPKNSEVSESRPSKLRKMIDLQLPADEYMDEDEIEQCRNEMTNASRDRSFPSRSENIKSGLADLNEPPESEEINCYHNQDLLTKPLVVSEVVSRKPEYGNIDGSRNISHCNDKGNGQNWLLSVSRPVGGNANGNSYHHINHFEKASLPSRPEHAVFENRHQPPGAFQPNLLKEDPWPTKLNDSFKMFDKSRPLSGFGNLEGVMTSHLPSYAPQSNFVNSWDNSWRKPSNYLNRKPTSVYTTPFLETAGLSKGSQSSAPSNGILEAWLCRNERPRTNPTAVRNGFYHGSSSGGHKDFPASFSNAGPDYANGSYNDRASGSSNFLNRTNSLDLNSTRDLNLNVPYGLSSEPLPWQGQAKREDSVSVPPWLRANASTNVAARSRNSSSKPESGLLHGQRELQNGCEARNVVNLHNPVASTSCNLEAARLMEHMNSDCPSSGAKILGVPIVEAPVSEEREMGNGKKMILFDMNVAFEELDDNDEDKIGTARSDGVRNMFDLNSCIMEEEIPPRITPSCTNSSIMEKPERAIIDLEAPVDLEAEDDVTFVPNEGTQLPSDSSLQDLSDNSDEKLRVAAEAIVAISISAPEKCVDDIVRPQALDETSALEETLSWFVDIACSGQNDAESPLDGDEINDLSSDSDYFEEMTLNQTECSVEEYFPSPPIFDILTVEDTGHANVTGRARRGPSRRGRQRRDFQRDILPGLTSLARQEVTEDLQTFGGLMRATGHAWHCGSRRNSSRGGFGRGRRKAVVAVSPPPPATPPPAVNVTAVPPRKQLPRNTEIMLEDRSLTSWGKTTRRPRRQRLPSAAAGNPAPIPMT